MEDSDIEDSESGDEKNVETDQEDDDLNVESNSAAINQESSSESDAVNDEQLFFVDNAGDQEVSKSILNTELNFEESKEEEPIVNTYDDIEPEEEIAKPKRNLGKRATRKNEAVVDEVKPETKTKKSKADIKKVEVEAAAPVVRKSTRNK